VWKKKRWGGKSKNQHQIEREMRGSEEDAVTKKANRKKKTKRGEKKRKSGGNSRDIRKSSLMCEKVEEAQNLGTARRQKGTKGRRGKKGGKNRELQERGIEGSEWQSL